jgi:hypothetical protein
MAAAVRADSASLPGAGRVAPSVDASQWAGSGRTQTLATYLVGTKVTPTSSQCARRGSLVGAVSCNSGLYRSSHPRGHADTKRHADSSAVCPIMGDP